MDLGINELKDLVTPIQERATVGDKTQVGACVAHKHLAGNVLGGEKGRHGRGNAKAEQVDGRLGQGLFTTPAECGVNGAPELRARGRVSIVVPGTTSLLSIECTLQRMGGEGLHRGNGCNDSAGGQGRDGDGG